MLLLAHITLGLKWTNFQWTNYGWLFWHNVQKRRGTSSLHNRLISNNWFIDLLTFTCCPCQWPFLTAELDTLYQWWMYDSGDARNPYSCIQQLQGEMGMHTPGLTLSTSSWFWQGRSEDGNYQCFSVRLYTMHNRSGLPNRQDLWLQLLSRSCAPT